MRFLLSTPCGFCTGCDFTKLSYIVLFCPYAQSGTIEYPICSSPLSFWLLKIIFCSLSGSEYSAGDRNFVHYSICQKRFPRHSCEVWPNDTDPLCLPRPLIGHILSYDAHQSIQSNQVAWGGTSGPLPWTFGCSYHCRIHIRLIPHYSIQFTQSESASYDRFIQDAPGEINWKFVFYPGTSWIWKLASRLFKNNRPCLMRLVHVVTVLQICSRNDGITSVWVGPSVSQVWLGHQLKRQSSPSLPHKLLTNGVF